MALDENTRTVGSTKDITNGSMNNVQETKPLLNGDDALQPYRQRNHEETPRAQVTRSTASAWGHFKPQPVSLSKGTQPHVPAHS